MEKLEKVEKLEKSVNAVIDMLKKKPINTNDVEIIFHMLPGEPHSDSSGCDNSCNYHRSIDISVAFLQAKTLDREVYLKPLEDQRADGYIWILTNPYYGL